MAHRRVNQASDVVAVPTAAARTLVTLKGVRLSFIASSDVPDYVNRWCCVRNNVNNGWNQNGTIGTFNNGNNAANRYSGFRVSN